MNREKKSERRSKDLGVLAAQCTLTFTNSEAFAWRDKEDYHLSISSMTLRSELRKPLATTPQEGTPAEGSAVQPSRPQGIGSWQACSRSLSQYHERPAVLGAMHVGILLRAPGRPPSCSCAARRGECQPRVPSSLLGKCDLKTMGVRVLRQKHLECYLFRARRQIFTHRRPQTYGK
ncbi:hypothetical protein TNCV_5036701 [Trichonephila clavipes]|nr:hypothetical protein TNCV_5036701 [Trichonephila clavipes]